MKKGMKGFDTSGIFPLNPEVFTYDDFASSLLIDESSNTSLPSAANLSM